MPPSIADFLSIDPDFVSIESFLSSYETRVQEASETEATQLVIARPDGTVFRRDLEILLPDNESWQTERYLERLTKMMLWQQGGSRIHITGNRIWADKLSSYYSKSGARAFDVDFVGQKLFGEEISVEWASSADDLPPVNDPLIPAGGHLEGCRIGFDLGGSDRKCAALIDGKVVFSEETRWDPYFQSDPQYHIQGIEDSLKRAAEHLPRVDAIGGSAAGVYINNEVRAGSLFRGVSNDDFDRHIRNLFKDLERRWGVPVVVVNDGEVTALAASMSAPQHNGVLGVSLGTSTAVGYVRPDGNLTSWLNELAFSPVDVRDNGPLDEWSGDRGCAVQYFSQQAVARLGRLQGWGPDEGEGFPEFLVRVQEAMKQEDPRAVRIYQTIGCYLGATIPFWKRCYDFSHLLLLGRVMSGSGGELIQSVARSVLERVAPELLSEVAFLEVDERDKRHGQAIAAASLVDISDRLK